MGIVTDIQSKDELDVALAGCSSAAVHFWASWCEASKQMDQVFSLLCIDYPNVLFLRVEAEEQPEIAEAYAFSAIPYFVFYKNGKHYDTLEGANPSVLANKVAKISKTTDYVGAAPVSFGTISTHTVLETVKELSKQNGPSITEATDSFPSDYLRKRLQQLVDSYFVFLFMKGNPEQPKCKFSRRVVEILKNEGIEFGSFDILSDDEVREGVKKFSNWPTFPQLYCKGEFLGGCDIIVSMHESGELNNVFIDHGVLSISKIRLPSGAPESGTGGIVDSTTLSTSLSFRLKTLINSSPVMLFMKGKPDTPKCGFSNKIVELLIQEKIEFQSFDVLLDDDIQHGLKTFSNSSSYPQLYIKGELIGGSDIILEMHKSGELMKVLSKKGIIQKEGLEDRLKTIILSSSLMLFMKGTPDAPQCGFSSKAVNALRAEGISFGSFDILSDEEVRQGLKTYSNWPTFPQLYYKGELIGGCDIILELYEAGDLKSTVSE